ncbi:MAG: threonine/serine dehydratase [Pyrinomonadaceae bacterium]|nr:threonine/serine dehydratase [Pyrinomonadaceae bacterium]
MLAPTFRGIVAARQFIAPYLPKTPLVRIAKLSEELGCDYYAKLENLQPTGAFKVRGGVNLVGNEVSNKRNSGWVDDAVNESGRIDRADRVSEQSTLITASTGNHGQSIAYAGRLFDTRVLIYVPTENVNEVKMQAMRDLGAEVRLHGRDFDEARLECERVAREEGFRYVHSANEPKLIAGVGTIGLEIFDDLPDVDVIIAPAGGGSCAAGNCIAAHQLNPNVRVIAVQSEAAPAMWHAWRNRTLDPYPTMKTEHEGLATRVPFEMANKILWELLDDFVLVTDEEINGAIRQLTLHAKQVAEGAGAASLAAAIKLRDGLRYKKVVGIVTGGNIPLERLAKLMAEKSEYLDRKGNSHVKTQTQFHIETNRPT